MISEKTIQICGKDVQMRYCAAAETGYERLSGQSSDIFVPEVERDDEGNITNVKQRAKADDYIKLALAAIIAAYARNNEESPVTAEEILYDAAPDEVERIINERGSLIPQGASDIDEGTNKAQRISTNRSDEIIDNKVKTGMS